ncbi:C-type lectin domain family 4 member K Langerin [Channa argus]|uniref:C-type lectin domain family 4 member K Langerin n=1 Tax=Channa argus TaxID=215402 RepID=A0A6G1PB90_CHAAH|nr:C-type lectin domain family 4 member K Langerin [Channa argus]
MSTNCSEDRGEMAAATVERGSQNIEANFKTLTEERDELKMRLIDFDKNTLAIKTLTQERDELKTNVTNFSKYVRKRFWASNEPNSYGKKEEDCAEVRYHGNENNWNDAPCDQQNVWICEKKVPL